MPDTMLKRRENVKSIARVFHIGADFNRNSSHIPHRAVYEILWPDPSLVAANPEPLTGYISLSENTPGRPLCGQPGATNTKPLRGKNAAMQFRKPL